MSQRPMVYEGGIISKGWGRKDKFCPTSQALEMAGSDETEKALELQKQRERDLWLGKIL